VRNSHWRRSKREERSKESGKERKGAESGAAETLAGDSNDRERDGESQIPGKSVEYMRDKAQAE
jgi:hypothetical protein